MYLPGISQLAGGWDSSEACAVSRHTAWPISLPVDIHSVRVHRVLPPHPTRASLNGTLSLAHRQPLLPASGKE